MIQWIKECMRLGIPSAACRHDACSDKGIFQVVKMLTRDDNARTIFGLIATDYHGDI